MIDTNETLLDRVKCADAHDAWREFFHAYGAVILRYAQKLGLDEHRAEEVLQETMVTLMRQLPEFDYDRGRGRFRNYLLTIVHRKSLAAMRRAKGEPAVSLDSEDPWGQRALHDVLPAETLRAAQHAAEERWREATMEDALARLAADPALAETTWPVFRAYVVESRPVAEVAEAFGLKENAVYQIKNRLIRRLRTDVDRRMRDAGIDGGRS
ncbi:MAG: sigma-70 family RNA polymerase sigma factor [Opitutae bacterium]|nr:sigma-70 family RNA polymerase sigma factor [Opitutae bacterium]